MRRNRGLSLQQKSDMFLVFIYVFLFLMAAGIIYLVVMSRGIPREAQYGPVERPSYSLRRKGSDVLSGDEIV